MGDGQGGWAIFREGRWVLAWRGRGAGGEGGRSTPERKGIRRGRLKACAVVFPIPLRSALSGLRAIPRFGL